MQAEMSAYLVTDEVVKRIRSGKYDVIILNYANCDMVGHTGVFEAAVKAVETVDTCLGRMLAAIDEMGGRAFVTADHGNADRMTDEEGKPFTAHTTNPVPFIAVGFPEGTKLMPEGGRLADIAPTMLAALGLHTRQAAPAVAKQPAPLSDTERRVLAGIGPKPVGIEELCVSTGLPMSALLGTLMKLELTGRVYKQPGQRYVLR